MRRLPKEYRKLLKAAIAQGATAVERKDGIVLRFADGGTVIMHTSPGSPALHHKRRELEKHGVRL